MNNVVSITVGSVEIPRTWYPFNEQFGTNSFELNGKRITIPEGFYDDKQTLVNALNAAITGAGVATTTVEISGNTLKTTFSSTNDISLNFLPGLPSPT